MPPTPRSRSAELDPARPGAKVRFSNAPAERIGTVTPERLQHLWDTLSILLAHELVGAAEALLYGTVEYMEQRMQFGRPIASFQALKHRCADLLMEVELAKALAREGARVLESDASPTEIAHMAKSMASDAAMSAARTGINCAAASASRGRTTPTSTSSASRAQRCCSARRSANGS